MLENALNLLCAVTVKKMATIYLRALRTHALKEGRLNTVKAPSNTSSGQGTSSILVGNIMIRGRLIRVLLIPVPFILLFQKNFALISHIAFC